MTKKKQTPSWEIFLFPCAGNYVKDRVARADIRSKGKGRFLFIRTLSYVVLGMVFLFLLGLIFPTLSSRPSIVLIISLAPFGFISAVAQWYSGERASEGYE